MSDDWDDSDSWFDLTQYNERPRPRDLCLVCSDLEVVL